MEYIWRFCLISTWSLAAFDKQHTNEKSSCSPNTFNKLYLKETDIKNKKCIKGYITKCECSQIWEQLQFSGTMHCNWPTAVVRFSLKSRLHHVKNRQKLTTQVHTILKRSATLALVNMLQGALRWKYKAARFNDSKFTILTCHKLPLISPGLIHLMAPGGLGRGI